MQTAYSVDVIISVLDVKKLSLRKMKNTKLSKITQLMNAELGVRPSPAQLLHSSVPFLSGHLLLFEGNIILRLWLEAVLGRFDEWEVTHSMKLVYSSWADPGELAVFLGLTLEAQK